jgi:hypothetical protein
MMRNKIFIPEISINTVDFSQVRFPAEGMKNPWKYFRENISQIEAITKEE